MRDKLSGAGSAYSHSKRSRLRIASGGALRADARQNYDRLVATAAVAFARDGQEATLKAVAAEAGVGIGTLYRHFPTREALVEAVYRAETQRLCDAAPELLGQLPPVAALRAWTSRFLAFMATKEGMADVLHVVLTADEGLRMDTRARLTEALAQLLDAGKRIGDLRPDLDPGDVFLALGGFALVLDKQPDAPGLADRLLALLLGGLARPPIASTGGGER
jgi:AcrR family transcriptional regulator